MENNCYYQLTYVDGDTELTMTFNADKTIYQIANRIQDFLKGASFSEDILNQVFKEEYDD